MSYTAVTEQSYRPVTPAWSLVRVATGDGPGPMALELAAVSRPAGPPPPGQRAAAWPTARVQTRRPVVPTNLRARTRRGTTVTACDRIFQSFLGTIDGSYLQ